MITTRETPDIDQRRHLRSLTTDEATWCLQEATSRQTTDDKNPAETEDKRKIADRPGVRSDPYKENPQEKTCARKRAEAQTDSITAGTTDKKTVPILQP